MRGDCGGLATTKERGRLPKTAPRHAEEVRRSGVREKIPPRGGGLTKLEQAPVRSDAGRLQQHVVRTRPRDKHHPLTFQGLTYLNTHVP